MATQNLESPPAPSRLTGIVCALAVVCVSTLSLVVLPPMHKLKNCKCGQSAAAAGLQPAFYPVPKRKPRVKEKHWWD